MWSGSERAILLWCAYTGAYVGALISTEAEPLADAEQQPPAAEAEERKRMVDPAKVSPPALGFRVGDGWLDCWLRAGSGLGKPVSLPHRPGDDVSCIPPEMPPEMCTTRFPSICPGV